MLAKSNPVRRLADRARAGGQHRSQRTGQHRPHRRSLPPHITHRYQIDMVDHRPDRLAGIMRLGIGVQRLQQSRDHAAIALGQAWMQGRDRRCRFQFVDLRFQPRLRRLVVRQLLLNRLGPNTLADRVHPITDALRHVAQLPLAVADRLGAAVLSLAVETLHLLPIESDMFRLQEPLAEAGKDEGFQPFARDRQLVGAGSLVAGSAAADPARRHHAGPTPAQPASNEAGKQVARLPSLLRIPAVRVEPGCLLRLLRLYGIPLRVGDDPQIRGRRNDPFDRRPQTGDAPAAGRILAVFEPVPHLASDIALVVEDAGAAARGCHRSFCATILPRSGRGRPRHSAAW
nr:hypothetical protein [Pararhizobium mangrovi]